MTDPTNPPSQRESNICKCSTCGYEWPRGQHGGHDCVFRLGVALAATRLERDALLAEVGRLRAALLNLHETFPGPMVLTERKP